jgi:exopolysaccharide biosynthesis predicted pyruvyltransferase EpsI
MIDVVFLSLNTSSLGVILPPKMVFGFSLPLHSNLGDQIVIYGNQKSESKLIKDLCMSLIDIEPKEMFGEYQYLTY